MKTVLQQAGSGDLIKRKKYYRLIMPETFVYFLSILLTFYSALRIICKNHHLYHRRYRHFEIV